MKKVLCLITTMVLLVSLLTLPVQAADPETASSKSNPAAEARSGVVRILSILKVENGRISYSTGSGLAVGNEGESSSIFITNNHVINGAKEVYVLLDNQWEESVPTFGGANDNLHAVKCEIVYTTSGQPDYAILQACRVVTERVSLPLMLSHEANPGDTIFALGYPGVSDDVDENVSADIDSITITRGTISRFTTLESEHSKAIQIDADINKGNSGGPLITEEGYVIGLNTWYVKDEYDSKVCLALEIDYVIDKLNQLVSNGTLADFTFTVIEDRSAQGSGAEFPDSTEETTEEDPEGKDLPLLIWGGPAAAIVAVIIILLKKKQQPVPVQQVPVAVPVAPERRNVTIPAEQLKHMMPTMEQGAYRLVGLEGQFAGKRIALERELKLGRNPNSDIVYDPSTPGISSTHCVLVPRNDGVLLTDMGSTYGTYLGNGTKLVPNKSVTLRTGDTFYLGDKRQLFQIDRKRI